MQTAIAEQVRVLIELQKIDGQIFLLAKERSQIPFLEKKNAENFEKKKTALKAAEDAFKTIQLKQKEKEGDLQAREEKTRKLQGQLYQLKSNKEYTAMEMEIKGLKADQSVLEEDILRLLDAVDEAKARVVKEKTALAEEEIKFKEETARLAKQALDIQAQSASLEEKRKEFLPAIDRALLSQYERILKGRDGSALVPVRNNSCGGCHMELPPQAVNEIQMQEKIIVCESCARILYWSP